MNFFLVDVDNKQNIDMSYKMSFVTFAVQSVRNKFGCFVVTLKNSLFVNKNLFFLFYFNIFLIKNKSKEIFLIFTNKWNKMHNTLL